MGKQDTVIRKVILVIGRIGSTLRFLAIGESNKRLMYFLSVSNFSNSHIVPEVCAALKQGLLKRRNYSKTVPFSLENTSMEYNV